MGGGLESKRPRTGTHGVAILLVVAVRVAAVVMRVTVIMIVIVIVMVVVVTVIIVRVRVGRVIVLLQGRERMSDSLSRMQAHR